MKQRIHALACACGTGLFASAAAAFSPGGETGLAIDLTNESASQTGYVRIGDADMLEPQQFTIECWLTPLGSGWGQTADQFGACLISKPIEGASGSAIMSWYLGWVPATETFFARVVHEAFGPSATIASQGNVPMGTAGHVAITLDGSTLRLYVNGQFDSEAAWEHGSVYYGADDVLIGAGNFDAGFHRRFDGLIDDVRLWDHAREQATIDATKDCRLSGNEPGLLAYYSFDAGDGHDDTGNGNNGAFVGMVSPVPSSNAVSGCPGACPADIDGSGDVGLADLLAVLASWGPCAGCPEDVDGSSDVGLPDLLIVLAAWGSCP